MAETGAGLKEAHQGRFGLSTVAVNVNTPVDKIIEFYQNTPNFNDKKTRYYLEYSSGKRGSKVKDSPPGCEKMVAYGLCRNKDTLCGDISHPLTFYSRKKKMNPDQRKRIHPQEEK